MECRPNPISSRACERGVRSCEVHHEDTKCIGDGHGDCDELTINEHGRCRDCDITYSLDQMECPTCKLMRYRTDAPSQLSEFAAFLWGDPCRCPIEYREDMTETKSEPCACHCHIPDHGITEHAPGSECCEAAVNPTPEELAKFAPVEEPPPDTEDDVADDASR